MVERRRGRKKVERRRRERKWKERSAGDSSLASVCNCSDVSLDFIDRRKKSILDQLH